MGNQKKMLPPELLQEPLFHPSRGIRQSSFLSHAATSSSGCKAFQKKLYHLGEEVRRGNREDFYAKDIHKGDPCVSWTGGSQRHLSASSSGLEAVHADSSCQGEIPITASSFVPSSPFCSHVRVREDRSKTGGAPRQDFTDSATWKGNYFCHPLHRYTLLLGHRNTPFLEDLFTVSRKKGATHKRSRSCCPSSQLPT